MNAAQIRNAAATSNTALTRLVATVQWDRSYVTKDKTFCVYLAENEAAILEHSRLSGFPADRITEVVTVMDPTTALGRRGNGRDGACLM